MISSNLWEENSVLNLCLICKIADVELENLCFEFGLEIEWDTAAEMNMQRVDDKGNQIDISKEIVYKFEVGANRYDLLCVEGLASTLKCYLGLGQVSQLKIKNQRPEGRERIYIKPET